MRNKLIFGITVVMTGLLALVLYSLASSSRETGIPKDKKHNVVLRFNGTDSEIPKDGDLLRVKESLEDTVVVEPATDDDCRRVLENHGQG